MDAEVYDGQAEEAPRASARGQTADSTNEHLRKMWAGQSNILVAVRVRPLLKQDKTRPHRPIVKVLNNNVVVILDPSKIDDQNKDILRANRTREKRYAFDHVFDPDCPQQHVYQNTTRFLIHGVLDGYNATVFAYGNTGAGKTYTMIGTANDPGIMVLTLRDLFNRTAELTEENGVQYSLTVSFLEVYNENIRDLLSDVEDYLDLREDPIKGPVVAGITEVAASSAEDVMELLHRGNRNRTQQPTAANEESSRSHAVLQITVECKDRAPGTVANIKIGKLSLVDLAGSERAANTKNKGARLIEGANINRSLLALGNCINALGEKGNKGNFVPYRDSKLTRLLKDSLGGNCRTVMIANISTAEHNFEETLNTLKYSNRAKNIKTTVQRNVLNVNYHISEYVQLINNLKGEITNLKSQLSHQQKSSFDTRPPPTRRGLPSDTDSVIMNEMRQKIVDNFQERMQLRRSLIELEDQNVQNSIEMSKRQLTLVELNDSSVIPGQENQSLPANEDSASFLAEAPEDIQVAWAECEQLRKAMHKNNTMKKNIAKRLRLNEKEAEQCREEIATKISNEERLNLMELQYQVGKLELENMELEQHRIVHDSIIRGKDLTIQKLQLQLAVRDKIIQRQRLILQEQGIDDAVIYNGLTILEQSTGSDRHITTPPFNAMARQRSSGAFTQRSPGSEGRGGFGWVNPTPMIQTDILEDDDSLPARDLPHTPIRVVVHESKFNHGARRVVNKNKLAGDYGSGGEVEDGGRVEYPKRRPRKDTSENTQLLGNRRRSRRGGGQTTSSTTTSTTSRTAAENLEGKRNGMKRNTDKTNGLPELTRLNGIDGRGLGLKPMVDQRFPPQSEIPSQPNSARDKEEQGVSRRPPSYRGPVHGMQLAGQGLRDAKRHKEQAARERQARANKPTNVDRDNTSITSNDDLLEASCDSVESESSSLAPKHGRNQNRAALNNLKLRIHGQQRVAR